MAAAVSIAPSIDVNKVDPLAPRRPPLPKPETEAPDAPVNKKDDDLLYRASDLGVLVADVPALGGGDADAASTTVPSGLQVKADVSAVADIPAGRKGARIVRLPRPSALPYHFELRQQWEGVVTRIARDEFSVVLRDLTPSKAADLEAVLPLEEVSEEDLPLLKEGAVLYWTIGYEHTLTGQRKRVSIIRLRRLPAWTRKDIGRVKERAAELKKLFEG